MEFALEINHPAKFDSELVLERMNNFKHYFRIALGQVLAFYPRAQVTGDGRGLTLRNSPPPIAKKHFACHQLFGNPA